MAGIGRRAYAEMFGPTVGDRVRLRSTIWGKPDGSMKR